MSNTFTLPIADHNDFTAEQIKLWLALHHAPGFGPARLLALIEQGIDPLQLLGAEQKTIFAHISLPEKSRHALASPDWDAINVDLQWAQRTNCHIIPLTSSWYPQSLREIADPPMLLFVRGDPELLHFPQLGMVGSRNPSHSGKETAFEFARHLSNAGLIITSGMATGIDAASHQGALAGSGLTVAVAGTGLDRVYPAGNKSLAESILREGTMVSEYSIGTPPAAHNFPRRNRIISGLSVGTLVVEAATQSGSLITAKLAMEQGREVFAIPGSIHNPLARGCHHLIRQGAKLVETGDDVLQELGPIIANFRGRQLTKTAENKQNNSQTNANSRHNLTPSHQQLLSCIEFEPISIDSLVQRSRLTPESISSMLVELELYGIIKSCGGLYSRL